VACSSPSPWLALTRKSSKNTVVVRQQEWRHRRLSAFGSFPSLSLCERMWVCLERELAGWGRLDKKKDRVRKTKTERRILLTKQNKKKGAHGEHWQRHTKSLIDCGVCFVFFSFVGISFSFFVVFFFFLFFLSSFFLLSFFFLSSFSQLAPLLFHPPSCLKGFWWFRVVFFSFLSFFCLL